MAGIQVYSVPARPMLFRDNHMRNDPAATRDQVTVAANCLLVKNAGPGGNLTILCDSGPGLQLPEEARRKLGIPDEDILLRNLASLGVTPDKVDVYMPSHFHWDHTGWVFEGGVFKLPNARVVMSQQARADNLRVTTDQDASFLLDVPAILDSLEAEGRLTLLDADEVPVSGPGIAVDWLGDGVRFVFSRGHSEGQMHAVFTTTVGIIVFGGDFWPTAWHATDPTRHMPMFDRRDTARLLADKAAFLPHVAGQGMYLYFYHDPNTLAAQVAAKDGGYELQNPLAAVCWA